MSLHLKRLVDDSRYANESVECLDDNVASEFVSGAMPHSSVTKVEKHLAGCRDCRDLVAALVEERLVKQLGVGAVDDGFARGSDASRMTYPAPWTVWISGCGKPRSIF